MSLLEGRTGDWEIVIGLEIHAQVTSKSKLFSGASTEFGAEPNTQVSLVDAAMPGMLPVINEYCVEQAVRTGLGLKAQINEYSVFDRKNYFYPDLPQGYQISQFKQPIVGEGRVVLDMDENTQVEVGIERLHLEQDAGKSIHDRDPRRTMIDLNRSGVPLLEIVLAPDLPSPHSAVQVVRSVRDTLARNGVTDGRMEHGSLRVDLNCSVVVDDDGSGGGVGVVGGRVEVKNLNSLRSIRHAASYEFSRQTSLLARGLPVPPETRSYDPRLGRTVKTRDKEEGKDYRFVREQDVPEVVLGEVGIDVREVERGLREGMRRSAGEERRRLRKREERGSE